MYVDFQKNTFKIKLLLTEIQNKCHTSYSEDELDNVSNCIGCDRCFNCNYKICICIDLAVQKLTLQVETLSQRHHTKFIFLDDLFLMNSIMFCKV